MKKSNDPVWMHIIGLILILLVAGCTGGTPSLKHLAPVYPPETLPAEIVLDSDNRDFRIPPRGKGAVLSMTQSDVTVSVAYWRRADLDFKYNRGSAVSPFYSSEGLHQGDKVDVFYVKIANNGPQNVFFSMKGQRAIGGGERVAICEVTDQGENRYPSLVYFDLEERLRLIPNVGGLYVKNGLTKARAILLEKQIPKDGIPGGKSVEGFLPFQQFKLNARELELIIPLEKAPPEGTIARYQNLVYRFPYMHSESIRHAQPATIRY